MRWAGHVERMRLTRRSHIVLVGRPEIERPQQDEDAFWKATLN
jgi:hypothetical protein